MTKRTFNLPPASMPIDPDLFFVVGIDPVTGLGAQTELSNLGFTSGSNANVQSVTQAQYDALTPDPNTLYLVDNTDLYLGIHQLSIRVDYLTLPTGSIYVDSGLDIDVSWDGLEIQFQLEEQTEAYQGVVFIDDKTATASVGDAVASGNNFGAVNITNSAPFYSMRFSRSGSDLLVAAGQNANINILLSNLFRLYKSDGTFEDLGITNVSLPDNGALVDTGFNVPSDSRYLSMTGEYTSTTQASFLTSGTVMQGSNDINGRPLQPLIDLPTTTSGTIATETNSVAMPFNNNFDVRSARASNGNLLMAVDNFVDTPLRSVNMSFSRPGHSGTYVLGTLSA